MFGAARTGIAHPRSFKCVLFVEQLLIEPDAVGFRDDVIEELDAEIALRDIGHTAWARKPVNEGSSVGVAICHSLEDLAPAVEKALCFDDEVLVERFIAGKEVSVAILDGQALGAVEIAPHAGFYDYQNKYTKGATDYHVPPRLSPERYRGCLAQALRAHAVLGCTGATRVDMMVSDSGNEFVLEVNTLPGMTPTSLLPKIAAAAGIEFGELCERILASATLASRRGRGERRIVQRPFVGEDRRDELAAEVAHH